jgi:hypothetical protein
MEEDFLSSSQALPANAAITSGVAGMLPKIVRFILRRGSTWSGFNTGAEDRGSLISGDSPPSCEMSSEASSASISRSRETHFFFFRNTPLL